MKRSIARVLSVLTLAVGAALTLVPMGTANADTIVSDGSVFETRYHAGNIDLGGVDLELSVQLYYDSQFNAVKVRGHGMISKVTYLDPVPPRVQVDEVRLGINGGNAILTAGAANSGTSVSATRDTAWRGIKDDLAGCRPVQFRVRVYFSARWGDGSLSKFSALGPPTSSYFCLR